MNKIYVIEHKGKDIFGVSHYVIVLAAENIDVARDYVKEKLGISEEPIWIMGATYTILYDQSGKTPLEPQVKILYRCYSVVKTDSETS